MSGGRRRALPLFPPYTELPRRVPVRAWWPVRAVTMTAYVALCGGLVVRPAGGLFAFWNVIVPTLPLLFFVAPGVWRNLCPLAAANQLPRVTRLSRALQPPRWLRERGYTVAVLLFVAIVVSRRLLFNSSGPALAALLAATIVAAFATGTQLKGKSGWCSSICPLLPVQRIYGQTPLLVSPNAHCQPCVGCAKNCYDFNPLVAYQADLHDQDAAWSGPRKLFAGVFPGLVAGYFGIPATVSGGTLVLRLLVAVAVSAGLLFALDALLPVPTSLLAATFGAAAINIFYWYAGPVLSRSLATVTGWHGHGWLPWLIRVTVLALSLVWLARTFTVRRRYLQRVAAASQQVTINTDRLRAARTTMSASDGGSPEVTFEPGGEVVVASSGESLLDVAERCGQPLEAGCRLGVCGADPVVVLDGADRLSPVGDDEANTLRRLGLGSDCRMACSAQVRGRVRLSLDLSASVGAAAASDPEPFDASVQSVVVIGGGIAGVTTADFIRRRHPACEIQLVAKEPYPLYNRMGISRLVYGRSAMQGLHLVSESWYDDKRIGVWLNTLATGIDVAARTVTLGTGDTLTWDRLVLATGSAAFVPPVPGYSRAGTFTVRDADDAIRLRSYVQAAGVERAVVAGGGLLGLEAAYALRQLGLHVTVLERSERLLRTLVDARTSSLLQSYLLGLGIALRTQVTATQVDGDGRCESVQLSDGTSLPAEVFVVAAGIAPHVELARAAGLTVNRGVVVDSQLRTSHPDIYAVGDVAEVDGQCLGLWPVAVAHAEVAAANVVGGSRQLDQVVPVAILKGVGIDLVAAGRVEAEPTDEVVLIEDPERHMYRKLVVADGVVVGGIVLGMPVAGPAMAAAVRRRADVTTQLERLRAGDWEALDEAELSAGGGTSGGRGSVPTMRSAGRPATTTG